MLCTNSALEIANYIVCESQERKMPVSNLKLQKLLYFVQCKTLRATGSAAFDDDICAWKYGPVVPSVYLKFSNYLASPILRKVTKPELADELVDIIKVVLRKKLRKNAWDLVAETRTPGSPWEKTYNKSISDIIPLNLLAEESRV